jgi:hypothetical protein
MARPKGLPKTGGRVKGSLSQKNRDILEIVQRTGCEPAEVLAHFCNGDWKSLGYEAEHYFSEKADGSVKMNYVINPEMRLHAAKELCKYLYPQRKAMEVSTQEGQGFAIVIKDYTGGK